MQKNKLWFKAKTYGYGWTPCTWEGWLAVAVFVGFNMWNFARVDANSHSNSDTIRPVVIDMLVTLVVLIWICVKKGEKARWRWGK